MERAEVVAGPETMPPEINRSRAVLLAKSVERGRIIVLERVFN